MASLIKPSLIQEEGEGALRMVKVVGVGTRNQGEEPTNFFCRSGCLLQSFRMFPVEQDPFQEAVVLLDYNKNAD